MSHFYSSDWKAWNEERQRYLGYNTQGFIKDLEVLQSHIVKLKEVAPKDKAGWPDCKALRVLDKLDQDLALAKTWHGLMPAED